MSVASVRERVFRKEGPIMVARQAKNAPKGKDGKGTGGQFAKDTRGADPKNIPTAADANVEEPSAEMLAEVEDVSYDDVYEAFEEVVHDPDEEHIDLGDSSHSDWLCLCGNTAWEQDFYPYNGEGEEVDVSGGDWDGVSYFCMRCCRVFNKDTGAVTDRPESIVTLNGHIIRVESNDGSLWDDEDDNMNEEREWDE